MSHWSHKMVDGAKFWVSCQQLKLLRKASHWQLIQNLAPSTIVWRPCDIRIDLVYYCFLHQIFRSSTASDGLQNGMKHFFKEHSYFHVTSAFTRFIFTSWIFILTYYELCINILWKLNVQKIEIALSEWTSFNNISCFRVVWLNSCLPKKTFFESKVRYCKAENDQILKNLECISIAPYLCFQK